MSEHLSGSVSIRGLALSDGPELAAAYVRNRDYLQPWDPVRPESFFTSEGQQDAVAHSVALQNERRGFFWILMDGLRIVGRIFVSNVVRGQKVLERCSFTRIGMAPKYLCINGAW